jgi:predicted transcriptional regulator
MATQYMPRWKFEQAMAELGLESTEEMSAALGISQRQVQRYIKSDKSGHRAGQVRIGSTLDLLIKAKLSSKRSGNK